MVGAFGNGQCRACRPCCCHCTSALSQAPHPTRTSCTCARICPYADAYHCVPDYDVSGDAYDVLDLSTGAAMPVPTEDGIATCRNACEAAGDDCHFFVWWGERSACFLRHEPLKGTTSRSKTGPVGKKQGLVTCLRAYTHGHQPPPAPSSAPLEDSLDYHGVAVRSMVLQTIYSVQRAEECKERCKQSPSCEHVVYQARVVRGAGSKARG